MVYGPIGQAGALVMSRVLEECSWGHVNVSHQCMEGMSVKDLMLRLRFAMPMPVQVVGQFPTYSPMW